MRFRQEADEYEIWYSETDDPNEDLKMFTMNKWESNSRVKLVVYEFERRVS